MNFLAHCYLSGNNNDLIIGNFIADSVKGKEIQNYSESIQKGIELHRKIDFYTDNHPIVAQTNYRLKPYFKRYSSVVSDIYYDHFLALYWANYSNAPLSEYTTTIYTLLKTVLPIIPQELVQIFPYMVKNNWLFNYQTFYGLEKTFIGMSNRTKYESNMENGVEILKKYYQDFESEFITFFPDLIEYSVQERRKIGFD